MGLVLLFVARFHVHVFMEQLLLTLEEEETAVQFVPPAEGEPTKPKEKPKRKPLPPELPRNDTVLSPDETCNIPFN